MFCYIKLSVSVVALLIAAVFTTFFACGTILMEKNGNPKLKGLMFAMLWGIINYHIIHVFVFTGLIDKVPFLLRGFAPFYYVVQPAIYFYVVVNLDENYSFSKIDLLHLIPAVYAIIDNFDYYSGGPQHWQYWAREISDDYSKIANYQGTLMKAKYNFILRVLLYVSYTLFAWRYYIKNIQLNREIKSQFVLKWLKLFLIVISIFVVSVAFSSVYNAIFISSFIDNSNLFLKIPIFVTGLAIITLATYILLNPLLLYGLPKINYKTIADNKKSLPNFKSLKNDIDEVDNKEYNLAQTIISEIKEKKLYLNPDFSIALASEHFSIPSHHISFILNNHINKSFPDIICEMRIDHSIELLKDNSNKKYTMEAIGNISGFNSRTTYYVSFKKITGISPNVYLQNLKLS